MSNFLKILISITSFYCTKNIAQAQHTSIRGIVLNSKTDEKVGWFYAQILPSNKNFIFTKGIFKIDSLTKDDTAIVFMADVYFNTIINLAAINSNADSIRITLTPGCKYDLHKTDKFCDKCKTKKYVIPIEYGLLVSLRGPSEKRKKESHPGGCEVSDCQANWYCKKCKTEF